MTDKNDGTNEASELRSYLLGELEPLERDALERRLMTNDETFRALLIAEDELVDDYCADALGAHQRERFGQHFLSTAERRHQTRFGAALRRYVSAAEDAEPASGVAESATERWWQRWRSSPLTPVWKLSAAALIALTAVGVWTLQTRSLEPTRIDVFLASDRFRALDDLPVVVLGDDVRVLDLQLDVGANAQASYRAVLERGDGTAVFSLDGLSARALEGERVVEVSIPASRLSSGRYRVLLRGGTSEEVSEWVEPYDFRIERR